MSVSELHVRVWTPDLEFRSDGLTVTGLVVPYGQETPIAEMRSSGVIRYREQFVPGAFERAMRAPNRVPLAYNHSDQLGERLGAGLAFRESAEGLVGEFRLDPSTADKAREALTTSHKGLSIGFLSVLPRAGSERADSMVIRRSVILRHVAAVPEPAYQAAQITGIRSVADEAVELDTEADIRAAAERSQAAQLIADLDAVRDRWAHLAG